MEDREGSRTVFVTVGTSRFDSLISKVDEEDFLRHLKSQGYTHIIYQIGEGKFKPTSSVLKVTVEKNIGNFRDYIRRSDLVISHLGAGNLLEVFSQKKKAVFVPNPNVKGNHQMDLKQVLDDKFVSDLDSLKRKVENPACGTGNFYEKLVDREKFNTLIQSTLNSK